VPSIPEPPPGGFPQAPPSPATGAGPGGGGILDAITGFLSTVGGTLVDILPPIPRSILNRGSEEA
jgi:hypothetical protein